MRILHAAIITHCRGTLGTTFSHCRLHYIARAYIRLSAFAGVRPLHIYIFISLLEINVICSKYRETVDFACFSTTTTFHCISKCCFFRFTTFSFVRFACVRMLCECNTAPPMISTAPLCRFLSRAPSCRSVLRDPPRAVRQSSECFSRYLYSIFLSASVELPPIRAATAFHGSSSENLSSITCRVRLSSTLEI